MRLKKLNLSQPALAAILALLVIGLVSACSKNAPLAPTSPGALESGSASGSNISIRTSGDIEVSGTVASIDAVQRWMALNGSTQIINVAANAEIVSKVGGGETPIPMSAIIPSDSVDVRGNTQPDGSLLANRVRVRGRDDNDGNEAEIGGRVSSVDVAGKTIRLQNSPLTILVLPSAEIVRKDDGSEEPVTLADIVFNDSLDVRGKQTSDSTFVADRVRIRTAKDFHSEINFKAVIESIDYVALTFTVGGHSETITTDSNTFIFAKLDNHNNVGGASRLTPGAVSTGDDLSTLSHDGGDDDDDDDITDNRLKQRIPFALLSVGDSVEIYANRIDASTLYAVAVELEEADEEGEFGDGQEVEFKDTLATVDVATGVVTFMHHESVAQITDGTELRGLNGEALSLSDFAAGNFVEVKGFQFEGNNIRLVRMEKDNN